MKKLSGSLLAFALTVFSAACDDGGGGGTDDPGGSEAGSNQRAASMVLLEHAAHRQALLIDLLGFVSDDFSAPLFEGEEAVDMGAFFDRIEAFPDDRAEVEAALAQWASAASTGSGLGVARAPLVEAAEKFWNWATGAGERQRERTLLVLANMEPHEREQLFEEVQGTLAAEQSVEIDSIEALEEQLRSGDLDSRSPRIYQSLVATESAFSGVAQDRNLTPIQIVNAEAAEGVAAGGELLLDAALTIAGPAGDAARKTIEYGEQLNELYEDPAETIKGHVKDAIVDSLSGFVDVDEHVDAGRLSEDAGAAVKALSDLALGESDPDAWAEDAVDAAFAVFETPDASTLPDAVIVGERTADTGPTTVLIAPDAAAFADSANAEVADETGLDSTALPTGDWTFTATTSADTLARTTTEVEAGFYNLVTLEAEAPADDGGGGGNEPTPEGLAESIPGRYSVEVTYTAVEISAQAEPFLDSAPYEVGDMTSAVWTLEAAGSGRYALDLGDGSEVTATLSGTTLTLSGTAGDGGFQTAVITGTVRWDGTTWTGSTRAVTTVDGRSEGGPLLNDAVTLDSAVVLTPLD